MSPFSLYDPANQMTGITDRNASGTTLVSYGDTYDAAGRVTQETRTWASGASTDTVTYGYTNNDQLTSVTHTNSSFANESFTWDANGNQTDTGNTTSTGNEQTASPGWTYTYDADGNMITATQTSTGDVWTYSYDFRNRMTGAVEKNSSGTILAQATYTYDALDNRIGIDENGNQTWTLYDGSLPYMDFTGSGSLATRYLNGPAGDVVDEVLSRQSASGTVAWYLPDRLGTIRDLIDNSGNIIDHVDYSAFGTVLSESSPSSGDRMMGLAGMDRDTVTGLNLAVHRVISPATGRWTSPDPDGFSAGDGNLYRYVHNNPANFRDPSGLKDAGPDGGTVTISGGVIMPPGTMILPEGGGVVPYVPGKLPKNVDAIIIPGVGLLKIPDFTDVTITGFCSKCGIVTYKFTHRPNWILFNPSFYPWFATNPWGIPVWPINNPNYYPGDFFNPPWWNPGTKPPTPPGFGGNPIYLVPEL